MRKFCTKCGIEKNYNEFYKSKRAKNGLQSECKHCCNERGKIWAKNNPEKYKEIHRKSKKKSYKKNPEKYRERSRKYREENPEKVKKSKKKSDKKYREKNKEKLHKKAKIRRLKNIEKYRLIDKNNQEKYKKKHPIKYKKIHKLASKKYREKYPKKYKENKKKSDKKYSQSEKGKKARKKANKKWSYNNKEKVNLKLKRWRKKVKNIPIYKIKNSVRSRIYKKLKRRLLNKNGSSTWDFLPYTVEELMAHLEKQFKSGMTWNNYGKNGWDIDHIRPDSSFNYTSVYDKEFQECWALSNLQTLWHEENLEKSNKW